VSHYRRKWLNIRMVKESEGILETAAAADPPVPEHLTDQDILAALEQVPQNFRGVVLLVDVEEFSYKDAAAILGVPVGTVMSRLSRGRRMLREKLAGVARSYGIVPNSEEGRSA
jgi:RNA polymerase sigma-70 factor (ECF subfamily)